MAGKKKHLNIDDFMAVSSGSLREEEKAAVPAQAQTPISRRRTNSIQVLLNDKEFEKFVRVRDMMGVKNSEAGRQLLMRMIEQMLGE